MSGAYGPERVAGSGRKELMTDQATAGERETTTTHSPNRDTVTSLDPRDVGGWVWTVQTTDGPVRRYRTDADYEGLWVWIDDGPSGTWHQTRGHMQAHWPTDRAAMVATLAQQSGYDVTAL